MRAVRPARGAASAIFVSARSSVVRAVRPARGAASARSEQREIQRPDTPPPMRRWRHSFRTSSRACSSTPPDLAPGRLWRALAAPAPSSAARQVFGQLETFLPSVVGPRHAARAQRQQAASSASCREAFRRVRRPRSRPAPSIRLLAPRDRKPLRLLAESRRESGGPVARLPGAGQDESLDDLGLPVRNRRPRRGRCG